MLAVCGIVNGLSYGGNVDADAPAIVPVCLFKEVLCARVPDETVPGPDR